MGADTSRSRLSIRCSSALKRTSTAANRAFISPCSPSIRPLSASIRPLTFDPPEVGAHAEADGVGAGWMPQLRAISIEVVGEASTADLLHDSAKVIDRQTVGDLGEPAPHVLVIHR